MPLWLSHPSHRLDLMYSPTKRTVMNKSNCIVTLCHWQKHRPLEQYCVFHVLFVELNRFLMTHQKTNNKVRCVVEICISYGTIRSLFLFRNLAVHYSPFLISNRAPLFQTDAVYPEGCYHGNTKNGRRGLWLHDNWLPPPPWPPLLFAP